MELRCGFGKSDISPPGDGGADWDLRILSFWYDRAGRYGAVRDPLCARAAFFESAGEAACIVALDLIGDAVGLTGRIRERLNDMLGLPAERVMVACTHAHAAPETIGLTDHPVHPDWLDIVAEGAAVAVRRAADDCEPCGLRLGEAALRCVVHNRAARWEADGMQRLDAPERERYGMLDETLRVAAFLRDDGSEALVLFNFACHPVCVQARDFISADWPGAALALLERGRPAMFLNGACGDANPVRMKGAEDLEWTGRAVADKVEEILADPGAMAYTGHCALRGVRKVLGLPRREIPDVEGLEREARELEAKAAAAAPPGPNGADNAIHERLFDIREQLAVARMPETLAAEIHLLAVGELLVVGVPVELAACLGDDIRRAAPRTSWVAGYANGYLGYCVPRASYEVGGYETTPARWSPLAPGAAEMLRDEAVALVRRFGKR